MQLKALTFDIIGTVFDVYDGLAQGVAPLNARYGINKAGPAFALGCIEGYGQTVFAVVHGQPWVPPDQILQATVSANLPEGQSAQAIKGYTGLWRFLPPWPDVVAGMAALHSRYTLAVLSNMSDATQQALAAHAGLPFDRTPSAETVQRYKPDPAVYEMAVKALGAVPNEILMVAAHDYDVSAAQALGFRTAFVARPTELGPNASGQQPSAVYDAPSYAGASRPPAPSRHRCMLSSPAAATSSPS